MPRKYTDVQMHRETNYTFFYIKYTASFVMHICDIFNTYVQGQLKWLVSDCD